VEEWRLLTAEIDKLLAIEELFGARAPND